MRPIAALILPLIVLCVGGCRVAHWTLSVDNNIQAPVIVRIPRDEGTLDLLLAGREWRKVAIFQAPISRHR